MMAEFMGNYKGGTVCLIYGETIENPSLNILDIDKF